MLEHGLVVDDHPQARDWMQQALAQAMPQLQIRVAVDLADARAKIAEQLPDISLIDLGLPDGDGTALIGELHALSADTIKIVSTVFGDDRHVFDAIRAGAQGYVLKDEPQPQLVQLLQGIVDGKPALSAHIAKRLLSHFQVAPPEPTAELTERERDVLTLLAKGLTVKKAASLLEISPNTASGYVKNIYRKLNVTTRAEATMEANRIGLVGRDQ